MNRIRNWILRKYISILYGIDLDEAKWRDDHDR